MFPFNTFSLMFSIVPILVIGVFVFVFVKGISQWGKNNAAPMLNVQAVVVDKYTQHSGGEHHHTSFYVVFEVQSGDRLEFHVSRQEYSQLMEGDYGELIFQGTRFLDFQRIRTDN